VIPAQPAATVMLVRDVDSGDGVEVFMVRRAAGAAFAAGLYVFPGGRVDDADATEDLGAYITGIDDATASALLGLDRGGLAYWIAAIRECFEEAGLLLAAEGSLEGVDLGSLRAAVHRGELSMTDLCSRHGVVLGAGALRYIAHWVTPVGESPRRFDTRFFLAAAPDGQEGVHDDAETVASMWVRPAVALDAYRRGELLLMPPTVANLEFLDGCRDVAGALARADAAAPPPRIQPKIRRNPDGRFGGFAMPGDPDYDELS
jgi:8-oxo-dGTP pyrophosphatase MutT (NUDIX family)